MPVHRCTMPYLWAMHDTGPNPLIRLFLGGTAVGFALSALFVTVFRLLDIAGCPFTCPKQ